MASSSETPYTSAGADLPLLIHVTAPATLPAGYTFEAEINGDPAKLCTVEVPAGGVEEGQVFLAPLSKNYDGPRILGPTGHWKDGLFDCFKAGFCHPSFWCSLCCTQVAMAQGKIDLIKNCKCNRMFWESNANDLCLSIATYCSDEPLAADLVGSTGTIE